MEAIYDNARAALYAGLDRGVINNASPRHLWIRSLSVDREDYLSHPATGERIRPEDCAKVAAPHTARRPGIQVVISDGLNANAVNESLGPVLPGVKHGLAGLGCADLDMVITNGRVRAGYEIGRLTGSECVVHFIGERPGTGLNTLSAYMTYGLDSSGRMRWSSDLDHSATTAICGIHKRGKPPEVAVDEIVRCVRRILEARCSGVDLHAAP
jgi:ethanolamine ammonia-lyase large subunit